MPQNLFTDRSAWIWLPNAPVENCYGQFRCHFAGPKREREAFLRISVEGQYAAFFNGIHIPSAQYPDLPQYKAVQTIDAAPYTHPGENCLEIQVWYPGRDTSISRRESPGLRFELWQEDVLLCASSPEVEARPLAGYEQGPVPDITPQLGAGFIYHPAAPASWGQAIAVRKDAQLVQRPIPELRLTDRSPARIISQGFFQLSDEGSRDPGRQQQYAGLYYLPWEELSGAPKSISSLTGTPLKTTKGDGIYLLLDLGRIQEGYLILDATAPKPTEISVGFGEHLEDLRVRTSTGGRCFAVTCGAIPERHRFVHWFRRLGCRYLQVFIFGREAALFEVGLLQAVYPADQRPSFGCSDGLHQRINEVSRHTLLACMHEHYEDCPWREQALYGFDARCQMLAGYYAFGEFDLPRESLRLLALSQRTDGLLELCAPARVPVNIPSFSLAFVAALEEYCRYSGDLAFSKEMFPVAQRIVSSFGERVRDGLAWNYREPEYWNFYEWSPHLDGMPLDRSEPLPPSAEAGLQLFGLLAVQRLEKLAGYLSLPSDRLPEMQEMLKAGLEAFWDERSMAYASFLRDGKRVHQYAELIQSLALYTGACPPCRAEGLRQGLLEKRWTPISLGHSIFRYEALLQAPERYGPLVFREVAQRWGRMIARGAVNFWETDEGPDAFEGAGSLCHGWSGVPAYLYGAYALGVQPESPGVWRPVIRNCSGIGGVCGVLVTPEGVLEAGCTPGREAETWFCLRKQGEKIYF